MTASEMTPLNDMDRFNALFHAYYAALHRYAYTMLKDNEASADIVQQVFTRLWEKRHQIEVADSIKTYLYTNTYHLSLNKLRKEKNAAAYQMHAARGSFQTTAMDAESRSQAAELTGRIRQTLESLPAQCKIVFMKSRFDDKTYRQIATELQISVKTVEAHMGKALKIFRASLADYLPLTLFIIHIVLPW